MPLTQFARICKDHGLDPDGGALALMPDQILLHDALGTPVCLQLEAAGINAITVPTAVYCDHNTLQVGYRNSDDHRFLRDTAIKLGAYFSGPGGGICHQRHLERFAYPGGILLGADSHTPTCGGVGMAAIGVGGLTVVAALANEPYRIARPKIVGIRLEGTLPSWSSGKDVALFVLKTLTVKGGVGRVLEYHGPGVASLSVFDRATICNMGAETGATTSLFPSDARTHEYLAAFGREKDWRPYGPEQGAVYDEELAIDLSGIEPLVAMPHSPDNVCAVAEIAGLGLDQVCIGSCTNASYADLALTADIWRGRTLHPGLDVSVAAGTRRTLAQLVADGKIRALVDAGARLMEPCCGPCNAVGLSPGSGGVSLRTFNRNFKGRSGTPDAAVYLCSPQTAAVSALSGKLADPREYGLTPVVSVPTAFAASPDVEHAPPIPGHPVVKGPNIQPMPKGTPLPDCLVAPVELVAGDNITTDHILPGGTEMLAMRSNVPGSAKFAFERVDPEFGARAAALPPLWFVVGGENFGQGSSREHAVMAPLFLGMKGVIAKSFARIFRRNMINYGMLPLEFLNADDARLVSRGDMLRMENIPAQLDSGEVAVTNETTGKTFRVRCELTANERELLNAGGVLSWLAARKDA